VNHYKINVPLIKSFHYEVLIEKVPSEFDKKDQKVMKETAKLIFQKFLKELPPDYKNQVVYDLSRLLYSKNKLPFDEKTFTFNVEHRDYTVKIRFISSIDFNPNDNHLLDAKGQTQILDLIFGQTFSMTCMSINRNYFRNNCEFFRIGFGLELWKGAYASVRPSEVGLTWNLDSAQAAFQVESNLLDLLENYYNCAGDELLNEMLRDTDRQDRSIIASSFLDLYRGRQVKTLTAGYKKKIYGFGKNSFFKFELTANNSPPRTITIKDYLKEVYKINVRFPKLPCVNLGKETYIPVELCDTVVKQQKKFTDKQTADIIKLSAVPATERMKSIENWASNSGIDKDPILANYNINVNLKMMEVDGRVLAAPDIVYQKEYVVPSKVIGEKGSWDHRNRAFFSTRRVERWVVLNLASRIRNDAADRFCKDLCKIASFHGIDFRPPLDLVDGTRTKNDKNLVKHVFLDLVKRYQKLELIVVIFSGTGISYNVVKTCGDLDFGIATQGVEERNVTKLSDGTISNILLKINTKLGGTNFVLSQKTQL
jgi:eukaryotic translation initiation factor 2C